MFDFFKAVLVGICASAPLGPVVALVIQKTLNYGRNAGVVTGLGSAAADTLFAAIAVFSLSIVESFIDRNGALLLVVGGVLMLLIGILISVKNNLEGKRKKGSVSASHPIQSFFMAISNPGALALMFALMLAFSVDTADAKLLTVLGVACGASGWWIFFSWIVNRLGKRLNIRTLVIINRVLGISVALFGVCMLVRGLMLV